MTAQMDKLTAESAAVQLYAAAIDAPAPYIIEALTGRMGKEHYQNILRVGAEHERLCAERIAADEASAALIAMRPQWIKPTDRLPTKPGKSDYEYVDCLIVHKGNVKMRPWNCEHKCFDDEEYDDYFCDAREVELWMAVPALPAPPAAEAGVDGGGA